MKIAQAVVVLLFVTGCATGMPFQRVSEDTKLYQEATSFFDQGRYREAHDAYRRIAVEYPGSSWEEQARFKAAYILIYYKNPGKDYGVAAQEFAEFLTRFQQSALAREAATWAEVLKNFVGSRTGALQKEVESLKAKYEDVAKKLQDVHENDDTIVKERDALLVEKNALVKKVDDLLSEKDALVKEKEKALKDREGLAREKDVLENKVAVLNKERKALLLTKAKLEKSIHDLRMLDVKMERKRKKIQKE